MRRCPAAGREGQSHAHQGHELDAGRGLPGAGRPRGGPPRQHRAARAAQPDGGLHPLRAGGGRCRRAARRPRVPAGELRHHALLQELPGHHIHAARDPDRRVPRRLRFPQAGRVPPRHGGQRPRRQRAGRLARAGLDEREHGRHGQVPQLVQRARDLEEGAGDRPRREPCVLDGELPLDPAGRAPPRPRAPRTWSISPA